ncbi:hypothetical protein HDV05_002099, partial [Chytridiales sp. JEL 0842]
EGAVDDSAREKKVQDAVEQEPADKDELGFYSPPGEFARCLDQALHALGEGFQVGPESVGGASGGWIAEGVE